MTSQQKRLAFLAICAQVQAMEHRFKHERIQRESHKVANERYAEMVKQRELAQRCGGFSFLR